MSDPWRSDAQLCNQADCGTGSWLKPDINLPQRLIAALELTRLAVAELVKRQKAGRELVLS